MSITIIRAKEEERTMNCQKLLRQVMSLMFVVLVLSACSALQTFSVPQGQVRGILIDEEGHPFPEKNVIVLLATILDEESSKIQMNTSWQSNLDDSGAFLIEDVPSGKYCIIFYQFRFLIVLDEDEVFTFEVPQNSGIDLGRVDASKVRPTNEQ